MHVSIACNSSLSQCEQIVCDMLNHFIKGRLTLNNMVKQNLDKTLFMNRHIHFLFTVICIYKKRNEIMWSLTISFHCNCILP